MLLVRVFQGWGNAGLAWGSRHRTCTDAKSRKAQRQGSCIWFPARMTGKISHGKRGVSPRKAGRLHPSGNRLVQRQGRWAGTRQGGREGAGVWEKAGKPGLRVALAGPGANISTWASTPASLQQVQSVGAAPRGSLVALPHEAARSCGRHGRLNLPGSLQKNELTEGMTLNDAVIGREGDPVKSATRRKM